MVFTSTLQRRWVLKLHKPGGGNVPTMVLSETRAQARPIAWLGYPREHTVPRETWRQRRTQPNPARILTLEPERLEPMNSRGSDSGPPFGLGALKRLVTSDTQGRKLLLSSTHAT